ncbi:unnamed protein product [Penicillium egyptiacum]|uniref:NmrA-like domain-containing protein n=1 Tax=Penicillium egyptiacum TaxID=1303716 RepID=A0A9W4K7Q9_9EURO|nr:unnamed protein product [Penicillium egyptiacum]
MDVKIITIFGATGNQGGSVARSLLKNPAFHVRGITRNPGSDASKALISQGAEMVQANGLSPDEMKAAFRGSWGVFLNINSDDKAFTNPESPSEFDMGKIIVDAAAFAGVQHFVFSSGPPCSEMTNGKVSMKAMDMKYKTEQYLRSLGVFKSVLPLGPGWFLENFLSKEVAPVFGGFPYFPDDAGLLVFSTPWWGGKEDVPWLSISDDFGDIVQGALLDPETWNGHFIHGLSDIRSFKELTEDFQEVTSRRATWSPIQPSWEEFQTHGIHELEDVKLMFGFTQITGGKYFGNTTESHTASKLKKATAVALGYPEDKHGLVTVKEWFATRFGNATWCKDNGITE